MKTSHLSKIEVPLRYKAQHLGAIASSQRLWCIMVGVILALTASCGRITPTPQPMPTTDHLIVETEIAATIFARLATSPPSKTATAIVLATPTMTPMPTATRSRIVTAVQRTPTLPIPARQPTVSPSLSPTLETRTVQLRNTLLLFQHHGDISDYHLAFGSLDTARTVRLALGNPDQISQARKVRIEAVIYPSDYDNGMIKDNLAQVNLTSSCTGWSNDIGRIKSGIPVPGKIVGTQESCLVVTFECWVSEQALRDAIQ